MPLELNGVWIEEGRAVFPLGDYFTDPDVFVFKGDVFTGSVSGWIGDDEHGDEWVGFPNISESPYRGHHHGTFKAVQDYYWDATGCLALVVGVLVDE